MVKTAERNGFMALELKKQYKYWLVVPTSMGVRITPADGQPVHCGGTL